MRVTALSRRKVLFLAATAVARAQAPADVLETLRMLADSLSQGDSDGFLAKFDYKMPGYQTLRNEIEVLSQTEGVGSAIEVLSDEGDNQKRALDLDWVLEIADERPRRDSVHCELEREGKQWKIVKLDPVEFFKYEPRKK
jgi:hypothetical protein